MTRTATVRTEVADPALVAACVRPDNTAEMETRVEDDAVVTRIEREDTGGLQSTVDDYVVNVTVATEVAAHANRHTTQQS
ncbi:MAG: KEOPS complex subunit Pcc1 [Halobacterium sp.]